MIKVLQNRSIHSNKKYIYEMGKLKKYALYVSVLNARQNSIFDWLLECYSVNVYVIGQKIPVPNIKCKVRGEIGIWKNRREKGEREKQKRREITKKIRYIIC